MQIQENIPLAPYTTLRIGGPARYFAAIRTEFDLLEAIRFARERSLKTCILGGGSNLVIRDTGFDGLVLHLTLGCTIAVARDQRGTNVFVDAGVEWDDLVTQLCGQAISGIECLAGIPGLTGASPIQNIGAYGQEVAQTIDSVTALDLATLQTTHFTREQCAFAYRTSCFNSTHRGRSIITAVSFLFDPAAQPNLSYADLAPLRGTNPTPLQVAEAVREIRSTKGMYLDPAHPSPDHRSAGSFFKNPIVPPATLAHIARTQAIPEDKVPHWPTATGDIKLPAAWLIEQAGFPKGFSLGPVGISSRHTLALINRTGTATCADLLALRDLIVKEVSARFQVTLHQEPVFLS